MIYKVAQDCPKCGEGKMGSPKYDRWHFIKKGKERLIRSCTVCGYMVSEPTKDSYGTRLPETS